MDAVLIARDEKMLRINLTFQKWGILIDYPYFFFAFKQLYISAKFIAHRGYQGHV